MGSDQQLDLFWTSQVRFAAYPSWTFLRCFSCGKKSNYISNLCGPVKASQLLILAVVSSYPTEAQCRIQRLKFARWLSFTNFGISVKDMFCITSQKLVLLQWSYRRCGSFKGIQPWVPSGNLTWLAEGLPANCTSWIPAESTFLCVNCRYLCETNLRHEVALAFIFGIFW